MFVIVWTDKFKLGSPREAFHHVHWKRAHDEKCCRKFRRESMGKVSIPRQKGGHRLLGVLHAVSLQLIAPMCTFLP